MQIEFHVTDPDTEGRVILSLQADSTSGAELVLGTFGNAYDAMQALADALTTVIPEPPDLSRYDEAVDNVGSLASRVEEAEDAIRLIDTALVRLDDQVQTMRPATSPLPMSLTRPPLLSGRQAAAAAVPASTKSRPTLRKPQPPRTNELPEEQQSLGARVHGQLFGGPMRGRHASGPAQPPIVPDEEF